MTPYKSKRLDVMMLGFRGFPGVQGGVESHAQHLCPLLVEMGCDLEVLVRPDYHLKSTGKTWNGVKFKAIWTPKSKTLEALVHSLLGVLYAAIKRPHILHIHAIGPAIMAPLARLLGLRVVVTHHGPDYDRQKWKTIGRQVLIAGEYLGMHFANKRIVISKVIANMVAKKYGLGTTVIPNGVSLPSIADGGVILPKYALEPGKYVLLVSRLVPEKRHHDLINAFLKAGLDGWKLVIVGASDHPDEYVKSVLDIASTNKNVVCTGFQSGQSLNELYSNAGLFVLPSSHEGLPIALLEALSYGLPVIASDIPANLEINLPAKHYFRLGDIAQLSERIVEFSRNPIDDHARDELRKWIVENYNWVSIADATFATYESVFKQSNLQEFKA